MKRLDRLRSRLDFRRVIAAGRQVTRPEFVLYHAARDVPQRPRVGLAVPRRVGGATVRNRTKRLLREAARPLIPRLVACDIVVVARPAPFWEKGGGSVRDLESALVDAATRAGLLREQGASRQLPE